MKKALVVIGIMAAVVAVTAISAKGFSFGVNVPTSAGEVVNTAANAPADTAYDSCKGWADQRQNNTSYNLKNIRNEMKGKEFSNIITESDKPDRLELRATYNQFADLNVRCDKEKCYSVYCNKK